jgi:predicted PurR-regulated permease PerM
MSTYQEKAAIPVVASSVALGFIVLCLAVYILNVASAIIIPFVIAVFLWYLINAMARGLGRISAFGMKIPRAICFTLAILLLTSGMWEIFEMISQNVTVVARAAPFYQQHLKEMVPKIMLLFHVEHQPTVQELLEYFDLGALMTGIVRMLSGIAGKTVVVMFYTGFLLYEQRFFDKKISSMLSDHKTEDRIRNILRNIDTKVQRYIWVKTFVSALAGVLTFVLLRFWKVDFAVFWGLIAFFFNFIPYVGALLSIILPAAIALVQFSDLTTFLEILACLTVLHGLIGHALDPYLMGNNLNLSPIFIISSLAMWGMVWGIPGMFLSIPILAMIAITLSQFPATRPLAVLLSKTGVIDAAKPEKKAG